MNIAKTITVIIPAYRASATIGRAVNSLLRQKRPPDEILIIDDGSPDDLAGEIAQFGTAVTLVRKKNGGAASARNAGIDLARGNWIAFLDADDYWEPEKLASQLEMLERCPDVGLIGARWFEETPSGVRTPAVLPDDIPFVGRLLKPNGPDAFAVAMCLWTTTVLVNREVVGENRFVSGLEPAEDRDLWVRLVSSTTVFLQPQRLATYVQEPGSLSRSNVDRDCGNMLRVVHRHAKLLGNAGVRAQKITVFRRWAAGHLNANAATSAVTPAIARCRLQPMSLEAWWVVGKSVFLSWCRNRPIRRPSEALPNP